MEWTIVVLIFCISRAPAEIVKRQVHTCGEAATITENNTVIFSHSGFGTHNYGKNLHCGWNIAAPEGKYILLKAQSFDVEDDGTCSFDYLVAYDGSNKQANELGRFCGSSFSGVSSKGNQMYLEFITDDSDQLGGFQLVVTFTDTIVATCPPNKFKCENDHCIDHSYVCDGEDDCGDDSDERGNCSTIPQGGNSHCQATEFRCPIDNTCIPKEWLCDGDSDCGDNTDEVNCVVTLSSNCGQTVYTGEHGSITSPNYPKNYGNNEHCRWQIVVPNDMTVQLKFLDTFDLEDDPSCSYDKINIFTPDHTINKGPFCGSTSPGTLSFPTNNITVEFVTDDSDPYRGFRLEYTGITKS